MAGDLSGFSASAGSKLSDKGNHRLRADHLGELQRIFDKVAEFSAQFIDHLATAPSQHSSPRDSARTPEYA
ncbi:hypothetical protein V1279_001294 [Bradyrhizobium sp. AZCC 1610]